MATKKVNIPRSVEDPFYRYQRSLLTTREGRGNTLVVENFQVVLRQVGRETSEAEVGKFFRKKLGMSAVVKPGGLMITGRPTSGQLETVLEDYIEKYVVCRECGNIETTIDDNQMICEACGNSVDLS